MAKANETIAEIIAKMRNEGHTGPADALEWVREKMTYYADILEAAHKREVQDALDTGAYVEASRRDKQSGNVAKLREACANIAEYARSAQCHTEDAHALGYLNQIEGWAKDALSAPVRNCDVGTPGDQAARFNEYCDNQPSCPKCEKCLYGNHIPCFNDIQGDCMCVWAQMPYKEGGNNANE